MKICMGCVVKSPRKHWFNAMVTERNASLLVRIRYDVIFALAGLVCVRVETACSCYVG